MTTDRVSVGPSYLHPAWWRLGATASLRAAKNRGWDADAEDNDAPWIGQDWDGHSNIKLTLEDKHVWDSRAKPRYQTVTAKAATHILEILTAGIVTGNVQVATLPDHNSVTCNRYERFQSSTLVINIDFGEFILPLEMSVNAGRISGQRGGIKAGHC